MRSIGDWFVWLWLLLLSIATHTQGALRDAVPGDFMVGGHIHGYNNNWDQGDYLATAAAEFNALTCSWYMGANGFATRGFERCVDYAVDRNMHVHAHSLVYPLTNQGYWNDNPNANVEDTLRQFIQTAMSVRQGQVAVWDVVNEVFGYPFWDQTPVDSNGIITNHREYHEVAGGNGNYIPWAFRLARQVDPAAILILLETNAEEIDIRSNNMYNYAVQMLNDGVPIDGVGFQFHVWHDDDKDMESVRQNFQRFADLGLRIYITEMDVSTHAGNSAADTPNSAQLQRQARIYREVATLARSMPSVKSLFLWDYGDDRSWLHPASDGYYYFPTCWTGGLPNSPPMQRKEQCYNAFYEGLASGSGGGGGGGDAGNVPTDVVRITCKWSSSSGYLVQDSEPDGLGGYGPSGSVSLTNLTPSRNGWESMKFVLVYDSDYDLFRIRNQWDDTFLSRTGIYIPSDDSWEPGPGVYFEDLQISWYSQLWALEYNAPDSTWRLINQWGSDSGFLTRESSFENGAYVPTNDVSLYPRENSWDSQRWFFQNLDISTSIPTSYPTPEPSPTPVSAPLEELWIRFNCKWGPATSYLGRAGSPDGSGGFDPGATVELAEFQAGWWSLQWDIISDPDTGFYRILNRWGSVNGYLTRQSSYDSAQGFHVPTSSVGFSELHVQWWSQLWDISETSDGYVRIVNQWDPSTGFLSRDSNWDGSNYQPSRTVSLFPQQDSWDSQYWTFVD